MQNRPNNNFDNFPFNL